MNAHALLNLLNELRKRDKMRGLSSVLSLFRNMVDKFNDTGHECWIHMTLKLFRNHILGVKTLRFCYYALLVTGSSSRCRGLVCSV